MQAVYVPLHLVMRKSDTPGEHGKSSDRAQKILKLAEHETNPAS